MITVEDTQSGDARVIAAGACTWADLPLPLAWIRDGDQHIESGAAPVIGTVQTITRSGNDIIATGEIDDASEDGAEVIRMMDAGAAPHGSGFFVSIDADDMDIEIVAKKSAEEEDDEPILAMGFAVDGAASWPTIVRPVHAAAGDPDPGPGGGPDSETVVEMPADEVLMRATRLRIRGVTLCAVPAFDAAFITLDGVVADEPAPDAVVAHAIPAPSAAMFADPEFTQLQRWLTYDADTGRVTGHLFGWNECHIGMDGQCVTPEMLMEGGLDYAMPGHVVAADGTRIGVMPLAIKGGHASTATGTHWRDAQAHYDDPDAVPAVAAVGFDDHGVWFSGMVKANASPDDIFTLRAHGVSGDWRRIGGKHRLIGACCVNVPGYPKAHATLDTDGELVALVAAGGRPLPDPTLDDCDCGPDELTERRLARLERLANPAIVAAMDARIGYDAEAKLSALDVRLGR